MLPAGYLALCVAQQKPGWAQQAPPMGPCDADVICKKYIDKGYMLISLKRWDEALLEYQSAYAISHQPSLLLSLAGILREQQKPLAAAYYERLYAEKVNPQVRPDGAAQVRPTPPSLSQTVPSRVLLQKALRGVLYSVGSGLLLGGLVATVNNRTNLVLIHDQTCGYSDHFSAKCYVPQSGEIVLWISGATLIGLGGLIHWNLSRTSKQASLR